MSKVDLTDNERAILWAVICWFERPIASGVLKSKLWKKNNQTTAKKYDSLIEDRIIEIGRWLQKKRDEDTQNAEAS